MEGRKIMDNNYGVLIFADFQVEEPKYLCLRENGELYTCKVDKVGETFAEVDVHELGADEAMIFISQSFHKAVDIIQGQNKCKGEDVPDRRR
jgi:hypothetical protein